jgi:ubiquinone/menaquinone biosynthesis C-methylase UbiE
MVKHPPLVFREAVMIYFPHQLSFLIDNPTRRLLISPGQFADRLPLTDSSRVLEIGPGSGYFSLEIARRIPLGHLELFDLQPEMLAKAQRKLESAGLKNIGYTEGDAADLPFPDAIFDVATLVAVLGEVREKQKCLNSLFRVLRAGGVAVFHEHLPDPDIFKLSTLKALVESAGFKFMRTWGRWYNYTAAFEKPEA